MQWITPEPAAPASGVRRPAASGNENEVDDFTTVGKGGKVIQFTSESIFKNLQAVQDARGKKVSPAFSIPLLSLISRPEYRSRRANTHT